MHSTIRRYYAPFLASLLMICNASAPTFQWDQSPDAAWGLGYRLHATNGTNVLHIDVGTNLVCSVTDLKSGLWTFTATAYTLTNSTVESEPSNIVLVGVPRAPTNMITVVVQWSGTVATTNWQDAGYFRLKLGLP